jgi:hypothetical protein
MKENVGLRLAEWLSPFESAASLARGVGQGEHG